MNTYSLKNKLEEKLVTSQPDELSVIEQDNTNSVAIVDDNEVQILSVVPEFCISISDAQNRIAMLQEFVKSMMVPGQDYGIIPNCNKPSLFKSGGEKLCDIFGFSKQIEVVNRIEDWKDGLFHYEVKSILINKRSGLIEAEGIGSCNNKEKKFASAHPFSVTNTILKMAKKRAFIDAVLSATRSSGLFSQDLEDVEVAKVKNSQSEEPKQVTNNQLTKIQNLVSEKSIPINQIKQLISQKYQVAESKLLSIKQADDLIKSLIAMKELSSTF